MIAQHHSGPSRPAKSSHTQPSSSNRLNEMDSHKISWARFLNLNSSALGVSLALLGSVTANTANAAYTVDIGENKSATFMVLMRTAFTAEEDQAASGNDYSKDFSLENIRLYSFWQYSESLRFTFDLERDSGGTVNVLDGYAQYEPSGQANFWAGRFLPPADRAVLAAPMFPAQFDFPFVHAFPSQFAGRDEGAMFWGRDTSNRLKYSVAVLEGRDSSNGGSNQEDNLSYAARLDYNFLDPEEGYYPMAWYDGAKRILAVGGSIRYQKDGAGTEATPGDFTGWNIDGRLELPLSTGGVMDLEASYYDYDLDDVADDSLIQGNGYYVTAGYHIPHTKIQPRVTYQSFDRDNSNTVNSRGDKERLDIGFHYLIDNSHNRRIDVYYSYNDEDEAGGGSDSFNAFNVRAHLVF